MSLIDWRYRRRNTEALAYGAFLMVLFAHQACAAGTDSFPISQEIIALEAKVAGALAGDGSEKSAAIAGLNKLLDERANEWGRVDRLGRLRARVTACDAFRALKGDDERVSALRTLQYAGFTTDQAIDIFLPPHGEPKVKKSIDVTLCILGLPEDSIRRVNDAGETVLWVWPKFFVHTEDAIVVEWTER